jgi:hypothetical protein
MGSAHPHDTLSNLVRGLLVQATRHPSRPFRRILSIDYRLCRAHPHSQPANPFPAALLDALAAYVHLVRVVGFKPKNIVVSGDSAGGNLALALVRYLRDAQVPDLVISGDDGHSSPSCGSPCGGLMCQSPWCDMTATHIDVWHGSMQRNRLSDIITRGDHVAMSVYGLAGFRGCSLTDDEVARCPYMSPGSLKLGEPVPGGGPPTTTTSTKGMFVGYPRCYFAVGGRELLLDEGRLTAERIQADCQAADDEQEGVDVMKKNVTNGEQKSTTNLELPLPWVTVSEEPEMFHDFCVFGVCEPARSRELARMVDWISKLP